MSGVISKIEKPTDYVSSLVMTTKPNGSLRICLDPQYLNTQIQREQILMPTLDEIISKLKGSKYFSTLDANKGFYMIRLSEQSKELTTFNTPYGRYHYNLLPFGLCTSPEIFHRVFSKIFEDISGVELYIDDILIHNETEIGHDNTLQKVLQRAREYGIKFNKNKCNLKQKEVKYLGHILTREGLQLDKDRVEAIIKMKEPINQKELLRFLGMINYYVSRFIPNVSEVTAPLRQLNKKDVPYIWSQEQQNAYIKLQKLLCEPPVLAYFDINKPIILSVDASSEGLGAVILQNDKPIAYSSRALTDTEKLYSQIEKESLAILYGCRKFYQYLFGQKFIVESDHKPLVSIFSKTLNKCPARLQKIKMALQTFDFTVVYKPGKELLIADHLSRSYLDDKSNSYSTDIECHVAMIVESFQITDNKLKEIIEETQTDEELVVVKKYIRNGWPDNKNQIDTIAKTYYSYRDELSECQGIIFKGTQIVIPIKMRSEILSKIHYAHLGIDKSKALARKSVFWPNITKEIQNMIENCNTCKSFQNNNSKETMINKEIPENSWEILATDIFFLYGKPYILTVDSYSKFIEVQKMTDLSTKCTVNNLKEIFARYGIPQILYTDSGTQFTGREFKEFVKYWNFEHKIISPKHHQGNGLAERYIQTVKRMLKKLIHDNRDIQLGLLIYRNTPVSREGKTPSELLFNRNVKSWLPNINFKKNGNSEDYKKELLERQEKHGKYYNKNCRNLKELSEGEIVKIQNENNCKPHQSGIVIGLADGPRSYRILNDNGEVIRRNRRMLIKGGDYNNRNSLEYDNVGEGERNDEGIVESGNSNENVHMENVRDENVTRSGRVVKKPSYLGEYVTH